MKTKFGELRIRTFMVCIMLLLLAPGLSTAPAAVMEDYCIIPPYVTRDVPPNIMIMMDNSAAMMQPAYTDNYTPNAAKNNYIGYFKPTGCYRYATNKFEEVLNTSVVPNRTYTAGEQCPTTAPFRGNLMNWATMSKYDVLQKVIIGGNTTSKQGNAHTLVSISASWSKSHGGCDFSVLNGNLTISETPSGGGCALLDTSLPPIASLKGTERTTPFPAAQERAPSTAVAAAKADDKDGSLLARTARKVMTAALWLWDNISIVSVAEAAACSVPAVNVTGTVGQPVSLSLTGSDVSGSPSYTWSMTTAPPFFSGVTPVLTGTKNRTATWTSLPAAPPNSPGVFNYTVTVQRGTLCGPTTVSGTITIGCPAAVDIQTSSLPNGSPGTAYSFTMTGINGVTPIGEQNPYTWSASGLPPGLSINSTTGEISGTPTACGSYAPAITLTDRPGPCNSSITKNFTLNITTTLQITTNALNPGVDGSPYSFTMNATGGVAPYTWSATGLPVGLNMTAGGWINGTPVGVGSYTVVVTLTGANGCAVMKTFTLVVSSTPLGLQITTVSLPSAIRGQAYSYQVQGAGGTPSYTWSATGLPAGLSINASTGLISGTAPNQTGTHTVTITLRDSLGTTVSKVFTLQVIRAVASQTFSVKVDLIEETLTYDSNGNDIFDPATGESYVDANGNGVWDGKSGVFQKYWDSISPKARWGLTNHTKQGDVNIPSSGCIPAGPASSFYTSIQNVQPSNDFPIAKGLYGDMNYYGNSAVKFPPYDGTSYKGCSNSDPIDDVKCRRNFVLIISSGADLTGPAFTTNPDGTSFSTANCLVKNGNQNHNLVKNACYGFTNDMRIDKAGRQVILTYAVNTMGTAAAGLVLEDAALAGGGKYYDARNISSLEQQLEQAFKDMLGRAASGTAASVLASGEGSGANLIQAVYYPRKKFGLDEIDWTGRLTNLWYYVDPELQNSNIREDDGNKVLTLKTDATSQDNVVQLYFDTTAEVTKARRWTDSDGNTVVDTKLSDLEFEAIGKLWEAGGLLWNRDLSTAPRALYTYLGTGPSVPIAFSTANKSTLRPFLQAASDAEAEAIIRYVHGEDTPFSPAISGFTPDYRPRLVSADGTGVKKTWKLGDILNSTPKISSWLPLNKYHMLFKDATYGVPGSDPSLQIAADDTKYITSTGYRGRNMIFAGANDGMLHAFKLGTLELKWAGMGGFDRARLTGTGLGEEAWAFIPKNALPYLKYTAQLDYCHVYSVDLTPFIFDASIGATGCAESDSSNCNKTVDSWRTVLIGGMRYGGACKPYNTTCSTTSPNGVCAPTEVSGNSIGYSSYFALDITDQNNPKVLWEYAHPQLGFTTAGPAVLRMSVKAGDGTPLPAKNGRWFVVLGSGPTGPITSQQFLATSDQNLRLFVLDLRDGTLQTAAPIDTGVQFAFAGSMLNAAKDTDLDYQDDVLYIPYIKKASDGTWGGTNGGGVLRLSTGESVNPNTWTVSKLMDNIGPVSSSVSKLQNNAQKTLWTFFGTGRYFYALDGVADDADDRRRLFGVKDPCFNAVSGTFDPSCTTTVAAGDLTNVTNVANVEPNPDTAVGYKGWFIDLDEDGKNGNVTPVADPTVRAERVITDPVAASSGVVFFTTFKPFSDICTMGGTSAIWAMKYNSGGDASTLLKGQALIQVSTGSIEQLNLAEAFRDSVTGLNTGNRKSASLQGVPPMAQGLSILSTPAPVKKVLHIKER